MFPLLISVLVFISLILATIMASGRYRKHEMGRRRGQLWPWLASIVLAAAVFTPAGLAVAGYWPQEAQPQAQVQPVSPAAEPAQGALPQNAATAEPQQTPTPPTPPTLPEEAASVDQLARQILAYRVDYWNNFSGVSRYDQSLEQWVQESAQTRVVGSEIVRLEQLYSFEILEDGAAEVWALEYRLKFEDLERVVMAGSMWSDAEGWVYGLDAGSDRLIVRQDSQEGCRLLAFSNALSFAEETVPYAAVCSALKAAGIPTVQGPQQGLAFYPLQCSKTYVLSSLAEVAGPQEAAQTLTGLFLADLSTWTETDAEKRTFVLESYDLQQLQIWPVLEIATQAEFAAYGLAEAECRENTWLVEPTVNFRYQGYLQPYGLADAATAQSGCTDLAGGTGKVGLLLEQREGSYLLRPRAAMTVAAVVPTVEITLGPAEPQTEADLLEIATSSLDAWLHSINENARSRDAASAAQEIHIQEIDIDQYAVGTQPFSFIATASIELQTPGRPGFDCWWQQYQLQRPGAVADLTELYLSLTISNSVIAPQFWQSLKVEPHSFPSYSDWGYIMTVEGWYHSIPDRESPEDFLDIWGSQIDDSAFLRILPSINWDNNQRVYGPESNLNILKRAARSLLLLDEEKALTAVLYLLHSSAGLTGEALEYYTNTLLPQLQALPADVFSMACQQLPPDKRAQIEDLLALLQQNKEQPETAAGEEVF